jgi:hypothetical protein
VTTTLSETKNAEKVNIKLINQQKRSAPSSIAFMNCLVPDLAIVPRFEMS